MRDRIVRDRVDKERESFIRSIDEANICRLASSYHENDPCTFFSSPARGSYNVCFFVRFHSPGTRDADGGPGGNGDRWVVRVPLPPYLAIAAHDKLESEVAVMQLLAARTTIPVPKLHAYSLAAEKGAYGVASFMILEYVEGHTLNSVGFKTITQDQLRNLHVQLADVYIQLRRLEFPALGRLASCSRGKGVMVGKRPMSNCINLQQVEGLGPSCVLADYGGDTGVLTSADDYVSMLLRIARNAFEKGRKSVYDEAEGRDSLYHLDQFSRFVKSTWLRHDLDSGPFVLTHGDLEMHNIIVNENLDILAVIDWEWSHVTPLQLFIPPTWITNRPITTLSWGVFYDDYVTKLDAFRAIVRDRELEMYGEELLSRDWATVHEDGGILVGSALENWTDIDYVAGRYLDKRLHQRKDLGGRVQRFMEEDPGRARLIARKVADWAEYRAERKRLGVDDSEDESREKSEHAKSEHNNDKHRKQEQEKAEQEKAEQEKAEQEKATDGRKHKARYSNQRRGVGEVNT